MSNGCPPWDDGGLRVAVSMRGGTLPAWLDRTSNGLEWKFSKPARQAIAETAALLEELSFGAFWGHVGVIFRIFSQLFHIFGAPGVIMAFLIYFFSIFH